MSPPQSGPPPSSPPPPPSSPPGSPPPGPAADVVLRPATPADEPAVLDLAASALGWGEDDAHRRFFEWKHRHNAFGASPMWVAEEDGALVGFRSFLRWELVRPDGSVARVARAVDTATLPAAQGRGIFSRLTTHGVEELRREGVAFIFNTPNDKSRPGYLKMGWRQLGRVRVAARPTSVGALRRLAGSRTAAAKWSEPTSAGEAASEVFADSEQVATLLDRLPRPAGLTTHRHPAYLAWRYGFGPLHYRVIGAGPSLADGLCVFRVRRRGPAREVAVVDVLAPDDAARRRLLASVARAGGGDYLLSTQRSPLSLGGGALLPGQGPILTWRAVCDPAPPDLSTWDLVLGDVELF